VPLHQHCLESHRFKTGVRTPEVRIFRSRHEAYPLLRKKPVRWTLFLPSLGNPSTNQQSAVTDRVQRFRTLTAEPQAGAVGKLDCSSRRRFGRAVVRGGHPGRQPGMPTWVLNRSTPGLCVVLPFPALHRLHGGCFRGDPQRCLVLHGLAWAPLRTRPGGRLDAARRHVRIYGSLAPVLIGACTVGSQALPHRAASTRPRARTAAPAPRHDAVLNGSTPADTRAPRDGVPSLDGLLAPRCGPDRQPPSPGNASGGPASRPRRELGLHAHRVRSGVRLLCPCTVRESGLTWRGTRWRRHPQPPFPAVMSAVVPGAIPAFAHRRPGKSMRLRRTKHGWPPLCFVMPAKAGIQAVPRQRGARVQRARTPAPVLNPVCWRRLGGRLDSRLRGSDESASGAARLARCHGLTVSADTRELRPGCWLDRPATDVAADGASCCMNSPDSTAPAW
jgi:hypothetical protein